MNILIINREYTVEFKYNKDCMKLVKELYTQLDDVHFQQIIKLGSTVYVNDHDYLIGDLKPKMQPLEIDSHGNPF